MAAGSLIYVGKSRLRRLKRDRRNQRKLEKELRKKEKRKSRQAQVILPVFVPEVQYSALHNEDNDNDSGIDQEEESLDTISIGSFNNEEIPLDFDIDLRPKSVKLGFNYVDFQRFTKMPFGPFKKKEPEKKKEEKIDEEKKATDEKPKEQDGDKNASPTEKVEKAEEKKVEEPEKKEEKNEDKTDGTKNEDDEKTKLDANGEVKSDGKISLEIKDVGGGKLGKSEGSPLLESEAPQPILCCTIL